MQRITVFVFLWILSFSANAQLPVLLRVVSSEQHDTLGCNIVAEVCDLAYKMVMNGKAKLWDSPEKEIQITGATLKEIEKSSASSFLKQPVIYIYEYWSGSGKNLKSVTRGFTFSNKGKAGEEVSYGYLDFQDIQDAVFNMPVSINADGNLNVTMAYYLTGKNYFYHIVQYGTEVVDNITASEKIKMDLTGGLGHFPNSTSSSSEIPQKMVQWMVDGNNNSESQKFLNGRRFFNAIEDFLKENKEIFYNLGGDNIITHVDGKTKLNVTRIEVKEVWKKIDNQVMYDPVAITIYVNDSSLAPVLYRDMIKMDVKVGLKSWVDFIREKQFPLMIEKINNQSVKRAESYLYQKALLTGDWNRVTEYVKYY
ncbi:MAG: hypothetical protein ABI772_12045 [Bacteroidota bacterium]